MTERLQDVWGDFRWVIRDWYLRLTWPLRMNRELWRQAQELAKQPYQIDLEEDKLSDGSRCWLATHPEFTGCHGAGDSPEEAIKELNEVRSGVIYFMLVDGLEIPAPTKKTTVWNTGA